jgi:hypothetical protein
MGSIRKQEANRRNAQKSTGPRSPAGRARASRNALKHGLAAARRDPDHFSMVGELVQGLLDELETGQEHSPELRQVIEAEIEVLRARSIRASLMQDLLNQWKENATGGTWQPCWTNSAVLTATSAAPSRAASSRCVI